MSMSEILAGLGLEPIESSSHNNLRESGCSGQGDDECQPIVNSAELASIDSFDGASISLNSDTLQDFGSVVSLPPGTLLGLLQTAYDGTGGDRSLAASFDASNAEDGTMTILSSEPSGVYASIPPPAPDASHSVYAISPHPDLVVERTRSISTACSGTFSDLDPLLEDVGMRNSDSDDSFSHSRVRRKEDDSIGEQSLVRPADAVGHDSISFEAVANHLMREAMTNKDSWYANFTEHDWDQFRRVANMVLFTLQPIPPVARAPLPPIPPACGPTGYPPALEQQGTYCAEEILPRSFICSLCSDVIVGCLSLDCGCAASSVCSLCWEQFLQCDDAKEFSNSLGFVWVERRVCPSCHASVKGGVPCHALDVAIQQIVEKLVSNEATSSLKYHYTTRLRSWGEEVARRHEERNKIISIRQDELLAQLIQEEENRFWNQRREMQSAISRSSTRAWFLVGQAAVAVFAATMASMGVNTLVRR